MKHLIGRKSLVSAVLALGVTTYGAGDSGQALRERLKSTPFKIAFEAYADGNSDIFVMNADGSNLVNLTHSPDQQEHYPQVSPDGSKICYTLDTGEGRDAVRSLWVMNVDGSGHKKIAENAREPFWSPDGKVIGYLPQEYAKFNVIDYYTKGLMYYHLGDGKIEPHPNTEKLRHLYHPRFSPNGKWIVATVHGGMGFGHAILLIEAHGDKIINLKIPGCRPSISPDGKHIAWGSDDHELDTAPLDTDSETPSVGQRELRLQDKKKQDLPHRLVTGWQVRQLQPRTRRGRRPDQNRDLSGRLRDHRRLRQGLEPLRGPRRPQRRLEAGRRNGRRPPPAHHHRKQQQRALLVYAGFAGKGVME